MTLKTSVVDLKNPATGKSKEAPLGFSWKVLFFGFFVPLFRGDWLWAVVMAALTPMTGGLSLLVFPFVYNKLYIKSLIKNGFKATSTDAKYLSEISEKLGYRLPVLDPEKIETGYGAWSSEVPNFELTGLMKKVNDNKLISALVIVPSFFGVMILLAAIGGKGSAPTDSNNINRQASAKPSSKELKSNQTLPAQSISKDEKYSRNSSEIKVFTANPEIQPLIYNPKNGDSAWRCSDTVNEDLVRASITLMQSVAQRNGLSAPPTGLCLFKIDNLSVPGAPTVKLYSIQLFESIDDARGWLLNGVTGSNWWVSFASYKGKPALTVAVSDAVKNSMGFACVGLDGTIYSYTQSCSEL